MLSVLEAYLTEEQLLLRNTIREFALKNIVPFSRQWDDEKTFPHEVIRQLGELGVMGMLVPEQYGGAGSTYSTLSIVLEELARHDGAVALTVSSHNSLCVGQILLAGNDAQKRKFLPDLASGKKLGAWALTESGSGSDAAGLKTRAEKQGDYWLLNGSKAFITQGSVAGTYVVLANTDPKSGTKGISAFILEKGMPGFHVGKPEDKLGCRASDTAQLSFDNVKIPAENLLGKEHHGFVDSLKILDRGRVMIASMAIGLGRGAIEEALQYAKQREQFSQSISNFQAIQWLLADSVTELSAAKVLTDRALHLLDQNKFAKKEASMAKLYASEAAMRITSRAIQVHGGYGYIKEYPVERYFRDVKICEIGEGTSEIQREVLAKVLLDD
jgi:alkylation response protein AidB-like acyl-CoA dehydrogenase